MRIPVATQDASTKHERKCDPGNTLNVSVMQRSTLLSLSDSKLIDVSEEEIITINILRSFVFPELLLHYKLCPVSLLTVSVLKHC